MRIPPLHFEALGNIYRRQSQEYFQILTLPFQSRQQFLSEGKAFFHSVMYLKSSFFSLIVSAVVYFIAGALSHSDGWFSAFTGRQTSHSSV